MSKPLAGKVAVVAGATRGAGRGIACMLGEAGATVYCSGRSMRGRPATPGRPETIEGAAELVDRMGGNGIPVRTDHTVEGDVAKLMAQVERESGRIDILVNDVWGGDAFIEWGKPFWEIPFDSFKLLAERSILSHVLTAQRAVPLLGKRALVVEVTDGDSYFYRGNLLYDWVKTSVIRLAWAFHEELSARGVAAVAVTPGFLRSEAMLEHFGVTEDNWREGAKKDPNFIASETPFFVGRAVAALAADPAVGRKSGRVFASWTLAREYGFSDIDGATPDWGRHFEREFGTAVKPCDYGFYAYWRGHAELTQAIADQTARKAR